MLEKFDNTPPPPSMSDEPPLGGWREKPYPVSSQTLVLPLTFWLKLHLDKSSFMY